MKNSKISTNKIIVIDHGSYSCKYGYGGYDKPIGSVRTTILKMNNKILKVGLEESIVKILNDVDILYPIKNGIIQDFNLMKIIWDDIFYNKLNIIPENNKIILSLSEISNDDTYKQKIINIMLNDYNFEDVQILNQQILALYGLGKEEGLVIDIGHNLTRIIPIYNSYRIIKGERYSNLSGSTINKYINHIFLTKELSGDKYSDDILNKIKKNLFGVNKLENIKTYNDFCEFDDVLLNPSLINYDCKSLVDLIIESINDCPIDIKRNIIKNIVLVGKSSLMPGFCKKLSIELKQVLQNNKTKRICFKVRTIKNNKNKCSGNIRIYAYKNRGIASWIGGSIICKLSSFNKNWQRNS